MCPELRRNYFFVYSGVEPLEKEDTEKCSQKGKTPDLISLIYFNESIFKCFFFFSYSYDFPRK